MFAKASFAVAALVVLVLAGASIGQTLAPAIDATIRFGETADPDREPRPAETAPPELFLPGRLIVKFEAGSQAARVLLAADGFEVPAKHPPGLGPDSLDDLLIEQRVTRVSPLFKFPRQPGSSTRMTAADHARITSSRYPVRQARAPGRWLTQHLENVYVLELQANAVVPRAAEAFAAHPDVEYAEPDWVAVPQDLPDDTFIDPDQDGEWSTGAWGQDYEDLWGLKKIDAHLAWDYCQANGNLGAGATVAVIDTGIDYDHEDIAGNVWLNPHDPPGDADGDGNPDDDDNGYVDDFRGWDFSSDDNDPADTNGHGTHVAGIVAATGNNGLGIAGVGRETAVMGLKASSSSYYAEAIRYAVDNGADILNLSWRLTYSSYTVEAALEYAYYGEAGNGGGCVLVAAAGNDASDAADYFPQNMREAIVVSNFDRSDEKTDSSNYGAAIDFAAPGDQILSLRASGTSKGVPVNEGYTVVSGTSMSAPYVAGLAALILSNRPHLDAEQLRQVLRLSSEDVDVAGWDTNSGYGRINAHVAVQTDDPCKARILAPATNEIVDGLVSVEGVAAGGDFDRYELSYKELTAPEDAWITLGTSNSQVDSGELMVWDVSAIEDGSYLLRLVVVDSQGAVFEDRTLVVIDRTYVSSPLVDDILRLGDVIQINGSVRWPGFESFHLEYEDPAQPGDWHAQGMHLTGGGQSEIVDGLIAEFNTAEMPFQQPDYYNLRIVVNGTVGAESRVYLDPTLKAGWPTVLPGNYAAYFMMQLVAADLDADGDQEIVINVPAYGQGLHALDHHGNPLPGWPVDDLTIPGLIYAGVPAVGDLDGDGVPEVVAVVSTIDRISAYVIAQDGSVRNHWELDGDTILMNSVLLADLNHDGEPEIITLSESFDGLRIFSIEVFDSQGNSVSDQWPRRFTSSLGQPCYYNRLPAVGNMDPDADLEIVFQNGQYETGASIPWKTEIEVLDPDGTHLASWGFDYASNRTSPAIGDIDGDGTDEIVFTTTSRVYAIDGEGQVLWDAPSSYSSSPALGDLDGDGYPEIVASSPTHKRTRIWDYQGNLLRQLLYGSIVSDPAGDFRQGASILGDIDGDTFPDVVVSVKDKTIAWNAEGNLLDGFPKQIERSYLTTPLLTDLDADGAIDVVTFSDEYVDKRRVVVYAWELEHEFNPSRMEWPTWHSDPQHTGLYVGGQAAVCGSIELLDGDPAMIYFTPESPGVSFDLVYGNLSDLRADEDFSGARCLGGALTNPATDTLPDPPPGQGRYYLARGRNDCLLQGFGNSSLPRDPRDKLNAANPCR